MKKRSAVNLILGISIFLLPAGWLLAEASNDRNTLYTVIELIKKVYVKETTDKQLVESAISGMLSGLDPHSSFMNEKEFEEMKTITTGEFGGIGIEMVFESPGIRVVTPVDDTPASKAGIKPGDLIFAVDDELIANMTPNEAVGKMRGAKNTKVKIGIIREGLAEPLEYTLTRDIIKAIPVKHHLYGDFGYIRIASFSAQTTDSVKKSIEALQKDHANKPLKGYVLDLRNNPGGILEQAVDVTNLFMDKGVIVSTKGRDAKAEMVFEAKPNALLNNVPLVILINSGTASAPEIVAGALQDHKKALIVGTKSFGKGSVQTVLTLSGYGAIKITTALYYTPSGRSIQAHGIIPDIIVEQAKVELLNDKYKKLQISEAKLRNHLDNKTISKSAKDIEKDKSEFWKSLYEQDYQLARAFDVLQSMIIVKKW